MMVDYLPSPTDLKPISAFDENGKEITIKTEINAPMSLQVFKNTYNQYQGLISIFKVQSGKIKVGDEIYCPNNKKFYRINFYFLLKVKNYYQLMKQLLVISQQQID